ncbi:hypothetical protein KZP23_00020 [Echinicola marina]|uniref:hypothetical protein n=1 Tax=Echinicola marina TaxID=2859768 RepID=UPI001CF69F20|nr:hypothetical protein [Echinicola marina]UCS93469.1 hypothetical protein KZP23_00020 [Echinicola marina]
MKTKQLFYLISLAVLGLLVWISVETFMQPGIKDLKMDFTEISKFRNLNNTGPIKRVYLVTVSDTLWQEMEKYGEMMPHTKYGNTQVYFFSAKGKYPKKVSGTMPYFDSKYNAYCLGKFEKKAMGEEGFVKYPFH